MIKAIGHNISKSGSFSIITNGSFVEFFNLKISGFLNSDWKVEEATKRAERELNNLIQPVNKKNLK